VDNAKLQLSYTRIVAPISGRIGLKQADLGNVVHASDANGLLSIAQTQPVNVVFAVPDSHLPRLTAALNDKASLKVEAWDRDGLRRLATGQLGSIDNTIDAATSTIKLKATFANDDQSLFPNQFVNVKLRLATLEDSLAVPTAALLRGAEGNFVYVVGEDKTVAVRKLQAGASDGDWVSVKGELHAGELVVTDGVDRLREGAQVEVIKPPVDTPDDGRRGGRRKRDGAGGPASASAPSASASGGPGGDFLARLPPEIAEKVKAMSPDERRAVFEQRRAERAKREAAGQ
jgi:multidrug efflux system membrane fusion protein